MGLASSRVKVDVKGRDFTSVSDSWNEIQHVTFDEMAYLFSQSYKGSDEMLFDVTGDEHAVYNLLHLDCLHSVCVFFASPFASPGLLVHIYCEIFLEISYSGTTVSMIKV